eukprot:CAMPEP_0114579280 /NCGR_PEP_ID=MMETSP0125-20121206/3689_1 /TAXON_ID=485358 ORGANISM="Aristerostoma sp., Strain ATCC 50986" /NCGR_SAMPLE_ID=MMETSP0125 /ASSEMBLY_ACC=CAM_ASM_000245 /LENGTH=52 /DNA_ID=CAMNT_0001769931 /DNA_START=490 /DNA_END=648 /DNA_ORIENTATION=-
MHTPSLIDFYHDFPAYKGMSGQIQDGRYEGALTWDLKFMEDYAVEVAKQDLT